MCVVCLCECIIRTFAESVWCVCMYVCVCVCVCVCVTTTPLFFDFMCVCVCVCFYGSILCVCLFVLCFQRFRFYSKALKQGGRRNQAVTSPQSFLFVGLTTLGTFLKFDWLVHEDECSNVTTINCNMQKG